MFLVQILKSAWGKLWNHMTSHTLPHLSFVLCIPTGVPGLYPDHTLSESHTFWLQEFHLCIFTSCSRVFSCCSSSSRAGTQWTWQAGLFIHSTPLHWVTSSSSMFWEPELSFLCFFLLLLYYISKVYTCYFVGRKYLQRYFLPTCSLSYAESSAFMKGVGFHGRYLQGLATVV